LQQENRIIVISGPNAGGKTLFKNSWLLQLMLQSGMLIPVHERSETFIRQDTNGYRRINLLKII
jgi:DNA mismatch repair protein MutS2